MSIHLGASPHLHSILRFEILEDRCVPTTIFYWTGRESDAWSNPLNWEIVRNFTNPHEPTRQAPDRPPSIDDPVQFSGNNGTTYTVNLDNAVAASVSIRRVSVILSGDALTVRGFISVSSGRDEVRSLFDPSNDWTEYTFPDGNQLVIREATIFAGTSVHVNNADLVVEDDGLLRAISLRVGRSDIGLPDEHVRVLNPGHPSKVLLDRGRIVLGKGEGQPLDNEILIQPGVVEGGRRSGVGSLGLAAQTSVTAELVSVLRDETRSGQISGTGGTIRATVLNAGSINAYPYKRSNEFLEQHEQTPVTSSLRIEGDYRQESSGVLQIETFPYRPGQVAFEVAGETNLAGSLAILPDEDTFNDTHLTLGKRTDVIRLLGDLNGRFEKTTAVIYDPRLWEDRSQPAPIRDDIFYATHYNHSQKIIQLLTTETPRLYQRNGTFGRLTTNGRPAVENAQLSLIVPGSAATASQNPPPGYKSWVHDLASAISRVANPDWDVATLNWEWFSTNYPTDPEDGVGEWRPWKAARQAMDIGESLRDWLRATGLDSQYTEFHLYSHSAGSWLINGIAQQLNEPFASHVVGDDGIMEITIGPYWVQMTMFDAFAPPGGVFEAVARLWKNDTPLIRWGSELPQLGEFADYAEHFVDRRRLTVTGIPVPTPWPGGVITLPPWRDLTPAVPFTDEILPYAVNFDVTNLDGILASDPRVHQQISLMELFINEIFDREQEASLRAHAWPHIMYGGSVAVALVIRENPNAVMSSHPLLEGFPRAPEFTGQRNVYAGERVRNAEIILPRIPTTTQLSRTFSIGPGTVGGPTIRSYNPDGSERFQLTVFEEEFTGGVRIAEADFNGDGVADIVVGTGPGRATQVQIIDGSTHEILFTIDPFEASFTGGVYVAVGDVNGDGIPDLVITPDEGGGPRVRVFDGKTFNLIADFFGIADPNFRGGARVAIGDVNGNGVGDLIVAAGFQGGPRIAGFDGLSLATGTPTRVFGDFFAFEQTLRNGVFVAVGDLDGDGFAEVIVGGGPGGGPRVKAFSGMALLRNEYEERANFFGGDEDNRGGIRVAVKELDGDDLADLVVGAGQGAGSRVTAYLGKDIQPTGTPLAAFDFDALPGFTGGVFVG